jgi:hypothetical protein
MESLTNRVTSIIEQCANSEVMLSALLQWALNPTSASAGYGLRENYRDIESNLSRVYGLSKNDAGDVVEKLKKTMASIIDEKDMYEFRKSIEKCLETEHGKLLREGLSKRLSNVDKRTQRFVSLLGQLAEDSSPSALSSELAYGYGMEYLMALYVAVYGEIPSPENLKSELTNVGALYPLTWVTARRYTRQILAIVPFIREATIDAAKPIELPDVNTYVSSLFAQPNYELIRLLDEVTNSQYSSIHGVARASEGLSAFVSAKGISGRYHNIVAVSPFIQPQLQLGISEERQRRLEPLILDVDRHLTDLRNRLYPKCELLWQDIGKEQRLWVWEATDCPRLYIYLTSWLTSQDMSKLYFDSKDPHLLTLVAHQSVPSAKNFLENRFYGPCSIAAFSSDGWSCYVVRGEKHPYLDAILDQLTGKHTEIIVANKDNQKQVHQVDEVKGGERISEPQEKKKETATQLFIGSDKEPPQYGLLGWTIGDKENREVSLDLNTPKTISIFGRQSAGKSYTVGAIAEMSLLNIPKVNHLAVPLSVILFHYSKDEGYVPEYISLKEANDKKPEIEILGSKLGVSPCGVKEITIIVPPHKLEKRRQEYDGLGVYPLRFNPAELRMDDWLMLMAASGSEALYIEELKRILKNLETEGSVDLTSLYAAIETSQLSKQQQKLAQTRLGIAEQYMLENTSLKQLVKPGRLTLVDLRDEMLESDEAMRLCLIALKLFSNVKIDGHWISKLIILDEAHKYMGSAFASEIETVVREMRHTASSVIIASQDPLSIPGNVIGLSSLVICHRITDGKWVKHIRSSCEPLSNLDAKQLSGLNPGEAFVWADKASVTDFVTGQVKIQIRPRVTKHGGYTITAV